MNQEGKIVKWQFTKGTSFEHVRTLLEDLQTLSQEQGEQIQTVFIDDCCKLRKKIRSIFGSNTAVKLYLPKRHCLYHKCLLELRQVFRQNGDSGMADTPPPEEITQFYREQMTDVSGKQIWTSATSDAIANLQTHVTQGCLSTIPPGHGTNRNERFHRFLNSFFNKSKIGVLLAYALMTVLIHALS